MENIQKHKSKLKTRINQLFDDEEKFFDTIKKKKETFLEELWWRESWNCFDSENKWNPWTIRHRKKWNILRWNNRKGTGNSILQSNVANHKETTRRRYEFDYTHELKPTLEALNLTKKQIRENKALKNGLLLAINSIDTE